MKPYKINTCCVFQKQIYGSIENRPALLHHYGDRHSKYDERNFPCPETLEQHWAFSRQLVVDKYATDIGCVDDDAAAGLCWNKAIFRWHGDTEVLDKLRHARDTPHLKSEQDFVEAKGIKLKCSK